LDESPSQSPYESEHRVAQALATQVAVACGAAGQARPHVPQCVAELRVSVSHPLDESPSQSAKLPPQAAMAQSPSMHAGVPPDTMHAPPQRPQCAMLVRRSTSQPLAASPSQSPYPALQA
jgi:hypothetical protein